MNKQQQQQQFISQNGGVQRVISRGTVGGRPAGERLFRASLSFLYHSGISPVFRPTPRSRLFPHLCHLYSSVLDIGDTNNKVISRDATTVSVVTPRSRTLSHQPGYRWPTNWTRLDADRGMQKAWPSTVWGWKLAVVRRGSKSCPEVTCVRRTEASFVVLLHVGPVYRSGSAPHGPLLRRLNSS